MDAKNTPQGVIIASEFTAATRFSDSPRPAGSSGLPFGTTLAPDSASAAAPPSRSFQISSAAEDLPPDATAARGYAPQANVGGNFGLNARGFGYRCRSASAASCPSFSASQAATNAVLLVARYRAAASIRLQQPVVDREHDLHRLPLDVRLERPAQRAAICSSSQSSGTPST